MRGERMKAPSHDEWIKEAKAAADSGKCGMYLFHNGVVRSTPKEVAREGKKEERTVKSMDFSYDPEKVRAAEEETLKMPGIYYVRAWLNEGRLCAGEDIMLVLIGGDIRPNIVAALDYLVGKIKDECVTETEIYGMI